MCSNTQLNCLHQSPPRSRSGNCGLTRCPRSPLPTSTGNTLRVGEFAGTCYLTLAHLRCTNFSPLVNTVNLFCYLARQNCPSASLPACCQSASSLVQDQRELGIGSSGKETQREFPLGFVLGFFFWCFFVVGSLVVFPIGNNYLP